MPAIDGFKIVTALTKKEGTYGTQIADAALLDHVPVSEVAFTKPEIKYRTDEEEINGYLGASEAEQEDRMFSGSIKCQASVETITAFLIWALQNLSTSGSGDPYTHTLKFPSVCTLNPVSFSFIEMLDCSGATGTNKLYKGVCVDQIVIEGNGKQRVMLTVTFKTDGSETAKGSFTAPGAAITRKKLLGSHAVLQLGTAGGSLTNYSSLLRTWKITINCGLVVPPNASNSTYVTEMQYGDKRPKIDFEFSLKCDKSHTLYAAADAGTLYQISFALDPSVSPARSVTLTMANGFLVAEPGRENREPRMNFKFNELHNSTNVGPATFVCKTANATYLVTSP